MAMSATVTVRESTLPPAEPLPVQVDPELDLNWDKPAVLAEPAPGSVLRFAIGRYRYVALRIDRDDEHREHWYTSAVEDRLTDSGGAWVGKIDSWARICEVADGEVEIATSWEVLPLISPKPLSS